MPRVLSEKPSGIMRYFRWPAIFAACIAIFLVIGVSTARESYREWKVDQEIRGLQAQIDVLEGKKLHLNELIQRLNSGDAIDKEARMRLGLRKPGERVIILRDGGGGSEAGYDGPAVGEASAKPVTRSNPQKWFSYFFRLNESL